MSTTATAPTTLCQRKAMFVKDATQATDAIPAIRPTNAPVAGRARHANGEDEDAEDRSVEERSELVHDFDQRAELGRPHGDDAGKQPPDTCHDLRYGQVVRVGRHRPQPAPVEIDHGRGGQRVQLAGDGIGRGHDDRENQRPTRPTGSRVRMNVGVM